MNLNTAAEKISLPEQLAENLLYLGFSISFEEINGIEFISATSEATPGGKQFFLPFDPVTTNAADFLTVLTMLANFPVTSSIVVAGTGERQILQNILKMQEIAGVEVWCLSQLKNYPLHLI